MAGYVVFNGVDHNYASLPRTADVSFLGDIDIISLISMPTLTPAGRVAIQNQHHAQDDQRSWRWSIEPSGAPSFWWSKAGKVAGTEVIADDVLGSFATPDEPFWIRLTHRVDNGNNRNAIDFCWSLDPLGTAPASVNWTILDSQTRPRVVSHFDSQARILLGALNAGNRDLFTGRYYKAWGSGTIGGTPEYNINFRNFTQQEQESAGKSEGRRGSWVSFHLTGLPEAGTDVRIIR